MTLDLPLARLKPGSLNPRKYFDEQSLAELTDSIAADGVLSNLIVRPAWCAGTVTAADLDKAAQPTGPDREAGLSYEIVSGERRYRAAKRALERDARLSLKIPVRVKAMTDPEVLAINLTEQMQRNELRPLEEAAGFEQLLSYKDAEGKPLHTADSLAARVGKKHDYVHARRRLLRLSGKLQQALNDGQLLPSVAEAIARVPDDALRDEAGQLALAGGRDGRPMTHAEVELMISEKFMVLLKGAPFDQENADLVPAAGKCSVCPMRLGNMPGGKKERARTDVCTNPACFRSKCQAAFLQVVAEANRLGVTVLTDKDSARNFEPHRTTEVRIDSDWVELDTLPMHHLLKPEVSSSPTWRQLHDKAKAAGMAPEVVLAKDGAGRGRWLVNSTLLIAAAEKLGEPIFRGQKGSDEPVTPRAGEDADDTFARGKREHAEKLRQEQQAAAEEARLRELVNAALVRAVHKAMASDWDGSLYWDAMLRLIGLTTIPHQWIVQRVLATKEATHDKLKKAIARQPAASQQALVPLLLAADSITTDGINSPALKAFAHLARVDLTAVAKAATTEATASKPKPKKPKVAKKSAASKAVAAVKASIKTKPRRGGAR
ncbi:MAG TPA: ParB N-terminal domain-containing protein [Lacunisphaera sp.]|nr:ParB N-terminal domain-containing protein [Lacunisphaera sp.]